LIQINDASESRAYGKLSENGVLHSEPPEANAS